MIGMKTMTIKSPPIGFTEPNFCAVLQGTKTETRRLLTLKGRTQEEVNGLTSFCQDGDGNWIGHFGNTFGDLAELAKFTKAAYPKGSNKGIKPKYNVGDRCYLTEPTRIDTIFAHVAEIDHRWYKAEKVGHKITENDLAKIKSRKGGMYKETIARFMLKNFARYHVEITNVRIERLMDITEESAIAEGIKTRTLDGVTTYWDYLENRFAFTCPKRSYISEIEMLHGKAIAQSNPWLWVYKFKLIGEN
jgi:hypothetical protein